MNGIRIESVSFFTAVLTGMILVCSYHSLRKLRRVIPHSLRLIGIEDGLYWIGATIYLFWQMYHTSDGEIRWYFVAGAFVGGVLIFKGSRRIEVLLQSFGGKRAKSVKKSKHER